MSKLRFPRTTVRKRISKAQKRDFAYTLFLKKKIFLAMDERSKLMADWKSVQPKLSSYLISTLHGKSVSKTSTLNPELVKTDLNFKYRSLKSVRILIFSGTAVTFLKRRLHYCIFAYHFYTCFHKSNECEAANFLNAYILSPNYITTYLILSTISL